MAHNLTGKFNFVVNLDDHDNKEIQRAVLPRTTNRYERALIIFDKTCFPPDIQTYKVFLETALARERGYLVPNSILVLRTKIPLLDATMSRDGLSLNNLTILLAQLWCQDFEKYRLLMLVYCFTSARTGEVHESTACRLNALEKVIAEEEELEDTCIKASAMAACYKHFILTVELIKGNPILVLTYSWEYVKECWLKNQWEPPIHALYKVYKEEVPLFFNLVLFMLPLFSADRAFRDYRSCAELLAHLESIAVGELCSQENQVIFKIQFKKDIMEIALFRPAHELDIQLSFGKANGADAFGKEFVNLGTRSGYDESITARACRRWALMETDKKTFGQSYAHPVCEVDGPASFLDIPICHEHTQNRRSMGIHYNLNLWQSPLAKGQMDKLHIKELKRQHGLQETNQNRTIHKQTLFHYYQQVMPERNILAQVLPTKSSSRCTAGRDALMALKKICSQHQPVSYRPCLQPVGADHIYGKPIFNGFMINSWYSHCQGHLNDPSRLLRCNPIFFRNFPVKPGLDGKFHCRHPACTEDHASFAELVYQLEDVHCFKPHRGKKRSLEL
ncbi:hypothetical protein BDW74DRAFT_170858 [Aspergillus multicolor]|uniref:uncharacterized protein n=1 Tax=Aspergillus multicolor TaxID=41759 RepID=UPI003CCE2290